MSIPYCPSCRAALPEKVESWICLESVDAETPEAQEDSDLGAIYTEGDDNDQIPYQDELHICNTFNKSGTSCSVCNKPQQRGLFELACPNPKCRMELPNIANCDSRTITVTGPSGSGKSHYIIALNYWWTQHLNRFRLVPVPAMGERVNKAFKNFTNQVLRKKRMLSATMEGGMISFSWHIKPMDGSRSGILFSLPDVGGGRLLSARFLLANRYYHYSSGVIFLIDADRMIQTDNPGAVTGSRDRNPADHFEVANAMITDFERRLDPVEVRNTPIAICVNKLDRLRYHDPRWDQIARDYTPFHDGYFDIHTCSERSDQIRNLLHADPDLSQALGLLEATFDHVMYFVIATIGSDTEEVKLMPLAVEDPFLYQLWHLNYITSNQVVSS